MEEPIEEPIEEHSDYPDLLDMIEKYGDMKKEDLVRMNHDESGRGLTLAELRKMSRGTLMVMVIDSFYGGTCH